MKKATYSGHHIPEQVKTSKFNWKFLLKRLHILDIIHHSQLTFGSRTSSSFRYRRPDSKGSTRWDGLPDSSSPSVLLTKIERGLGTERARLGFFRGFNTERARLGTFRGLCTERARLGTFRGFGTERARLGTFRGFGTERARLGTFGKKYQNFEILTQNEHLPAQRFFF